WLFGVTHTETSQVLLFPVLARDEVTVVRILQRFVDPGSRIVAEPGSFYSRIDFRSCGFEGVARNPLQIVRNSRVWAHTKAHFEKFSESTKLLSFESLVCEIIWRSWKRGDIFTNYLSDLKSIYTLKGPPQFTSNARPIFDTWVSSEEYSSCNFNFSFMDSASARPTPTLLLAEPGMDDCEGMVTTSEATAKTNPSDESTRKKVLGPHLPPSHQRSVDSDDLSDENPLTVKMESPTNEAQDCGDNGHDDDVVGPMPSEMSQDGEDVVQAAEEFERRSKRMKDKLSSVKSEADEGPVKREEWMTELPAEVSKNFGLQSRTFSKGRQDNDGGDRSMWTDTPQSKKDKESKGKKRKRDEEKAVSAREEHMQQQVEEYNKANRPESLLEMHSKKQKKKKNATTTMAATSSQADSTQVSVNPSAAVVAAPGVQTINGQQQQMIPQQQQQQQQHMQQYYQLTDEIRDSLDLLAEQKNNPANSSAVSVSVAGTVGANNGVPVNVGEYYGAEYSTGEFNEAKPLADLLMTPQVVNYGQQQQQQVQEVNSANAGGVVVGAQGQQQQVVFSSSQMIAQAYSHAQNLSQGQGFQQVVASSNGNFGGGQRVVTSMQDNGNGAGMGIVSQAQMQTIEVNGQQVQAQVVQQQQQQQQLQGTYAEAYANAVAQQDPNAAAALVQHQHQQHGGQVVTFSLANGQNMIIASPHTQQAGQNYVIQQSGGAGQPGGQSIVIAAPQQTGGNYVLKEDGELGQNIVLTQQNLQQALAQGMVLTQDGQLAAPEGVTVLTQDGQGRQQLHHRQPHHQQVIPQQIPQQVSLVLPQMASPLFQQVQGSSVGNGIPSSGPVSPQSFLQLAAKMDRLMGLVKESQTVLLEMNRRVERIEGHLFPQGVSVSPSPGAIGMAAQQAGKAQMKGKPVVGGNMNKPGSTSSPTVSGGNSSTNAAVTKASLKAALSSYLTISDYTATDELKRSDSNSDLFIPVGTVSLAHQGQHGHSSILDSASPGGDGQETASSTVAELPADQEMSTMSQTTSSSDINVPIVDSQSGMAVTVYDDGTDGQKFELGPGSSKEPNARFSNTSTQPKTVILDPRFWDILVEDFQKNMSSDQIITAMAATRKPLVRSIGTSEISICSTVLKEAETACQGRRERLAKELVFRIFTLGEVYDRNVSGVFYINGKKMENKNKALDPAKMAAIHYLVMKYPPSVVDNPRLERLVWKNCVDRINDALRRIYNWIHKIVDVNNIMDKLPTEGIMMH
ncbi:hypothetical protein EGW08_016022, partial [Elysia chlorotica]